jgi:hypothetical protein
MALRALDLNALVDEQGGRPLLVDGAVPLDADVSDVFSGFAGATGLLFRVEVHKVSAAAPDITVTIEHSADGDSFATLDAFDELTGEGVRYLRVTDAALDQIRFSYAVTEACRVKLEVLTAAGSGPSVGGSQPKLLWGYDRLTRTLKTGSHASIFHVGMDGRAPIQITPTDNAFYDSAGSWSPDRTKIVFSRSPINFSRTDVAVCDVATGIVTILTGDLTNGIYGGNRYSPVGTKIAFARLDDDNNSSLMVMDADGANKTVVQLGSEISNAGYGLAWSADGLQIVTLAGPDFELYVFNVDGSGGTVVPGMGTGLGDQPDWGGKNGLITISDGDGVKTVKADGSELTTVIAQTSTSVYYQPCWSPDNSKLACNWYDPTVSSSQVTIRLVELNGLVSNLVPYEGAYGYLDTWAEPADAPQSGSGAQPFTNRASPWFIDEFGNETFVPTTEPRDGDIAPGQMKPWWVATNGAASLNFKGKTLDGTVVAASQPLVP